MSYRFNTSIRHGYIYVCGEKKKNSPARAVYTFIGKESSEDSQPAVMHSLSKLLVLSAFTFAAASPLESFFYAKDGYEGVRLPMTKKDLTPLEKRANVDVTINNRSVSCPSCREHALTVSDGG